MRKPNLKALRMLEAAARHLNFRLAAEEMHLTQGAVAQQIRSLESDLGVKLFERLARGLALTEAGAEYASEVRRALSAIDKATEKLHPSRNTISLSVTPSLASKWLVPRLPYFMEVHPGIDVKTIASEALANFVSDGIDLAIRQGHAPVGEALQVRPLAPFALRAVCSPAYAESLEPVHEIADFAGHRLIQDGHRLWGPLFEDAGLAPPAQMMQFNQTALAMDAAANGQGIALAPKLLLEHEVAQSRLTELWQDDRPSDVGFYIVYPRTGGSNTEARDMLVDWLLSEGRRDGRLSPPRA